MGMLSSLKSWASSLKAQLLTIWFCRAHPDMPLGAKALAIFVVAYAFSPIDLIPDFIPVLGYLDEIILLPIGVYLVLRMVPAHVLAESRVKAEAWMAEQRRKPTNYMAGACVVMIWSALAYACWRYFS